MSDRRFYVIHLPQDQVDSSGKEFEIQLVDRLGVTVAFASIGAADFYVELDGELVPDSVIRSAKKLPSGKGEFVDASGNPVHPKNL